MTVSAKSIWFYGATKKFDDLVRERFGLTVSYPTTEHKASITRPESSQWDLRGSVRPF
jgi:hypothetical protein